MSLMVDFLIDRKPTNSCFEGAVDYTLVSPAPDHLTALLPERLRQEIMHCLSMNPEIVVAWEILSNNEDRAAVVDDRGYVVSLAKIQSAVTQILECSTHWSVVVNTDKGSRIELYQSGYEQVFGVITTYLRDVDHDEIGAIVILPNPK